MRLFQRDDGQYVQEEANGRAVDLSGAIVIRNIQEEHPGNVRVVHFQTVHLQRPYPEEAYRRVLQQLENVPNYMWMRHEEPQQPSPMRALPKKIAKNISAATKKLARTMPTSQRSPERPQHPALQRQQQQPQTPERSKQPPHVSSQSVPAKKMNPVAKRILGITRSLSGMSIGSVSSSEKSPRKKIMRGNQQRTPQKQQRNATDDDSMPFCNVSPFSAASSSSQQRRQRERSPPDLWLSEAYQQQRRRELETHLWQSDGYKQFDKRIGHLDRSPMKKLGQYKEWMKTKLPWDKLEEWYVRTYRSDLLEEEEEEQSESGSIATQSTWGYTRQIEEQPDFRSFCQQLMEQQSQQQPEELGWNERMLQRMAAEEQERAEAQQMQREWDDYYRSVEQQQASSRNSQIGNKNFDHFIEYLNIFSTFLFLAECCAGSRR